MIKTIRKYFEVVLFVVFTLLTSLWGPLMVSAASTIMVVLGVLMFLANLWWCGRLLAKLWLFGKV